MNMAFVIEPKSDQINADDLQGRTMTVTITDVKFKGGQEQPVSLTLAETDKVYRPCKSMCRVLVAGWGLDASQYAGKSLTLYCDPTVKFGPLAVGGIRISHMSHIDGEIEMALTATKGVKKAYRVMPLKVEAPAKTEEFTLAEAEADLRFATSLEELSTVWKRRVMAPHRESLAGVLAECKAAFSDTGEVLTGRSDADAEVDILKHLGRKETVIDVDSLINSRIGELGEEAQERVREAAMERIALLKGAK